MQVLLYCVADSFHSQVAPETGVAGRPVLRDELSELAIYFSEASFENLAARETLRESALQFHRVLQELFVSAGILPFRFPTLLNSEQEMMKYLEEHSTEYKLLLRRFEGTVQMEALISYSKGAPAGSQTYSGTEYLRKKQEQQRELESVTSRLQSAANGIAQEWRLRSRPNDVRCIALMKRTAVDEFNDRLRTFLVPEGMEVRVSGPWPPAEFFNVGQS